MPGMACPHHSIAMVLNGVAPVDRLEHKPELVHSRTDEILGMHCTGVKMGGGGYCDEGMNGEECAVEPKLIDRAFSLCTHCTA